jgi:hypothetical protein
VGTGEHDVAAASEIFPSGHAWHAW